MENIYIRLTEEFNRGKLRTVICSGQAAVLHRIAIMSKDGDWILHNDEDTCRHVLSVLEQHGAHYRFGAPLDIRWLAHGWSSHFEFPYQELRVRTDFFSHPPRLSSPELQNLWNTAATQDIPVVSLKQLAKIKQTNREKDYVIIGEIARRMDDPADQLIFSRSAGDLIELAALNPDLANRLISQRPILAAISEGRERLEEKLDAERRALIHANEKRLSVYRDAAQAWLNAWPKLQEECQAMPLTKAHNLLAQHAVSLLPFNPLPEAMP
ncbi:MAG: hypothetical protein KKG09_01420 [Verrucomicrobia bacterium]|nr:hypothetical protein [Verrucomicrobiota bacterium]MCG2678966.1 hypothetical protein [Kiritimatiellia bacterium]MBU4247622.1 hypothetical protein [Verrucomicrobiota bacterium]MBU4290803.1 hypothetical protein [Verrucomicrobiota bacterium]MBU4428349.1 hypothetical protein [Verrucomicrobiota bacterium]